MKGGSKQRKSKVLDNIDRQILEYATVIRIWRKNGGDKRSIQEDLEDIRALVYARRALEEAGLLFFHDYVSLKKEIAACLERAGQKEKDLEE